MLVIELERTSKNVCSYHEYRKIVDFEEISKIGMTGVASSTIV
jgi:hypothetical protein